MSGRIHHVCNSAFDVVSGLEVSRKDSSTIFVALGFAEDDTDRRILIGQLHVLVKGREVEVQLASVFGLELTCARRTDGHRKGGRKELQSSGEISLIRSFQW